MKLVFGLAGLAFMTLAAGAQGTLPQRSQATPVPRSNVLMVVADDLGVDQLAAYGEGADLPITPTIDALAASGVIFRNVWSFPNCSPTRAGIMTGRTAFRTGIGTVVGHAGQALPQAEWTLPEVLAAAGTGWNGALFGKWHLGNSSVGGPLAPNLAGWRHFDGTLCALEPSPPFGYYNWPRVVNGATWVASKYNTTATVDAAAKWIANAREPWLCVLSFNAPHGPFEPPPPGLYYEDLSGLVPPSQGGPARPFYKAMVEALDTELGRLLAGLGGMTSSETLILFTGDNGTPGQVTVAPFVAQHAKGTLYEGGINVPLIASGWGPIPPGSESDALVHTNDLFATVTDVAGIDLKAAHPGVTFDSQSLVPHLLDPLGAPSRTFVFTEAFSPNGLPAPSNARRAVRGPNYKLIRKGAKDELYDMQADPFETKDLLVDGLAPGQLAAYGALQVALNQVLSSD